MFIMSFKATKGKLAAACIISGLVVLAGIYAINVAATSPASAGMSTSASRPEQGMSNDERVDFLKSFGWEVKTDPVEVVDVIIPTEFDEVYINYNELQKKQGYDLTPYRGKKIKRYTYQIINFPNRPGNVRADVLILSDKIIGGNVYGTEQGDFMSGFKFEQDQPPPVV
ncbi:MAG: DUF4830 domain-containing protein [Oscillospiraceae bacterium]|nr:DUF4830 domain-containing protein [Oscillospiraceae bacterium]